MSSGKVLLGLLAGMAAGATLGILFAPDKGTSTRKRISKKGDDYVEELKDKFNDFLESLINKFESAQEESDALIEKGKSRVQGRNKDVKYAANEKTDR